MPIYGYSCGKCGHAFDKLQKMDAPAPPCPQCKAPQVQRQVSAASVRLAGNGWYETDFKSVHERRRNLAGDSPSPPAPSRTASRP